MSSTCQVRDDLDRLARSLLADGAWHDFEQVRSVLATRVPPGIAARQTERTRVMLASRRKGIVQSEVAPRIHPLPMAEVVLSGARYLARQVLKRRTYELRTHPKNVRLQVRLRPS